jgi:hypothetical protein
MVGKVYQRRKIVAAKGHGTVRADGLLQHVSLLASISSSLILIQLVEIQFFRIWCKQPI